MNGRTLLILLLFLIWSIVCSWYYVCKIKGFCGNSAPVTQVVNKDHGPLVYNWSKENAITNNKFPDYKNSVLKGFGKDDMLVITGKYYDGEQNNTSFPNLGLARAEKAKALFSDKVPADRIRTKAQKLPAKSGLKDGPFASADFSFSKILPIGFNWSSDKAITTDAFPAYKENFVKQQGEDKILEIVGLYYADEKNDTKYENLGLARANAVKALFADKFPDKKIEVKSKLLPGTVEDKDNPFEASRVRVSIRNEVIQESDEGIFIYFPFNSTKKKMDPRIDAYLNNLASQLKANKKSLTITGHTDDVGKDEYNYNLGLDRAKAIKAIVVGKGVASAQVKADSKGEKQPIATNNTEAGKQKNRRVELKVND